MLCCIRMAIREDTKAWSGKLEVGFSHFLTINWDSGLRRVRFMINTWNWISWIIHSIGIITVRICCSRTSYCRLKSLSAELEKLEDKLKIDEKNTSSLETQHKAAVAHNERLAKQVPTTVFQLCTSAHVCSYFNDRKQPIWTGTGEGAWRRVR